MEIGIVGLPINMPTLSVIIPTLNEEKYIPLLLADICKQSYKNYEVLVVDCKSTDKTYEFVEKFKKDIENLTIYSVNNRNIGYQRNFGGKRARGEWIIFLDADNRLKSDFFERIRINIRNFRSGVFFTTGIYIDSSNLASLILSVYINMGLFIFPKIGFSWLVGSFIGIRKSDFITVGGFHENSIPGEDYAFAKKAVRKGMKYILLFSPKYYFSFRRIAKYGFIKSLWNYSWGGTKNYMNWLNNRKW